jgi:hypothetical protein
MATGFLTVATLGAIAEDPSHEEHHPAGAAAQESQAPKTDAAPKPDAPADAKMTGGMMGGDHMSKMMKMMQEMHGKMMGGGMEMMPKGDTGPSSMALSGIMTKMHQDMAMTYSGNSDVDFVKGMIPHHQAAVDMAKTVLVFGKDPDVKKVAEGVIKAQEAEIIWLKEWLKKQGQ